MNDNFEIFKGQRGGQNLIYEDQIYTLDYNKDGTRRWRCRNRSCRVPEKCMFKRTFKKIKEQVATSNENSLEIIKKQLPVLSTSLDITKMPSIEYLRDTIKRTRNSRLGFITGCIMDIPEVLQGKSERSYSRAFDKCKELVTMNVENFVTDFERGLVNALRISFPEANFNGCLFHLGQAAYKRVGAMEDIEKFKNDSNYNLTRCSGFYEDIKKFIQDNSITTTANFQLYFENNYLVSHVTREDNGGRAVDNINFWNVFDSLKNEISRTSNNAESWNRIINKRMETRNTNIALFISRIPDCEEMDIYNLKRYKKELFEAKKTKKAEEKIRIIVKNYKHYSREEYMNALLQHVNFKCE
ncbi:MULE domain-containing protein [Vairimorpha necatrix]|uniref:MULE domain-containing protein n=1 Tax=Vairimorpha necatrix TaxID=6039 RepID=A0AAX4JBC2_9MICR